MPSHQQDATLKRLVAVSLGLMCIVMLMLSRDFSMSGDEAIQIQKGRNTYVYLARILHLLPGSPAGIKLDIYGELFGVAASNFAYWMPWWDEIHLRHFLIAITGFFAIVYAGKTAEMLHGRGAQLITIWLLFCSPRFFGASMNDSKDIPFAFGMMMAAYFLLAIVRAAPRLHPKHFTGLFFGLFIAIGVRIGGLMFGLYALVAFGYLALRHWNTNRAFMIRLALRMAGAALAAFLAAIIFVPKIWTNIPRETLSALHSFANYRIPLTMLYRGRDIPVWEPPWHYLPVWIGITVPVVGLAAFLLSPLLLRKRPLRFGAALLLLIALFPWLSIVAGHSPVYDAWRQFYFIYPPMMVLAGMAAAEAYSLLTRPVSQAAFSLLFIAGILPPVLWSIRNHPLQNVYFNEIVGGIDGAYGHFETDYYGESVEIACKKLLRQPRFQAPLRDSVYVVNNVPTQIVHYLKAADPRIVVRHIAYEARDRYRWEYGVFATRSLDDLLHRKDWPPPGIIDSVVADHTLLTVIVRRDTLR